MVLLEMFEKNMKVATDDFFQDHGDCRKKSTCTFV